ncbi:hypothetical protein [Flavobacterium sp.]|uniref:hypothetical protein n=1 Tax=Flavobacterium sp. TaxID=239 RepID=UPI00404768F7
MKKKVIKWIGIIGLIISSIWGVIQIIDYFINNKDKTEGTKITTVGKDNTIINGYGNTVHRDNYVVNNNVSSKNENGENEYSIFGTSNKSLIRNIENLGKIKIVPNSVYKIEIVYTGEISLLDKNSEAFIYSGGNILVKVDDIICFEFENLKIPELKPNSKKVITDEIQNKINYHINNNTKLFLNKIIECINKH